MKNLKKVIYSSMLVGALLLGGCGQIEVMENGMSKEYYDDVTLLMEEYADFMRDVRDFETPIYEIEEVTLEFESVLDSLKLKAKTDTDKEMNRYVNEFVSEAQNSIDNFMTYVESGDAGEFLYAQISLTNVKDSLNVMGAIYDKNS